MHERIRVTYERIRVTSQGQCDLTSWDERLFRARGVPVAVSNVRAMCL